MIFSGPQETVLQMRYTWRNYKYFPVKISRTLCMWMGTMKGDRQRFLRKKTAWKFSTSWSKIQQEESLNSGICFMLSCPSVLNHMLTWSELRCVNTCFFKIQRLAKRRTWKQRTEDKRILCRLPHLPIGGFFAKQRQHSPGFQTHAFTDEITSM